MENETENRPKTYCMIKNDLIESLAKTHLSAYETMIVFAIIRRTYGWKKEDGTRKTEDWISYSQIKEMTGITQDSHISRTIKILLSKNIITKGGKFIGINKNSSLWVKLPKGVNTHRSKKLPKGVSKVTKGGNLKLPKGADTKENIYTITNVIGDKSPVKKDFRNKNIQEGIELLKQDQGHVVKENLNRYALQRLYKSFGKENVLRVYEYACRIRGQKYAPQILNFLDLEQKWGNLEEYGKREKKERQAGYVDRPFVPKKEGSV